MTMTFVIDKEKLVMDLLKARKTYPEIAKEARVSFSFISRINRKLSGVPSEITKKLSIPSQALKLFSEGKSVLEVTIKLDRPVDEIRGYYEDYLDLKKMHDLVLLVQFHQHNLPIIKKMIRFILSNPVSQNDLIIALTLATDISSLRNIKKRLEVDTKTLNKKRILLENEYM